MEIDKAMPSLKNQAVNGTKWTTARTILTAITGPILLIVKTRYLTPAEFGVMAIINIFIGIIGVLENFGFNTAIIRKDEVTKDERSSLFFLQVVTSIVLALLLVVSSPLIANVFDMQSLTSLLPLLSLSILFNSPVILFTAFLEKEFQFKTVSILHICREIILLVSTTLLFQVLTAPLYAVVIGQVIAVGFNAVAITIAAFKYNLLHLRLHFKLDDIKPFFRFGVVVGFQQVVIQVTHNVDEMIIGFFLPESVLGYYHFAKNLLNKMRQLLTISFSKVLLPVLSKVKHERERLIRGYNQMSVYIATVTLPAFVGIALTTNSFIPIFFEERWLASSNFFIILAISYIPYTISIALGTNLLYSINKPKLALAIDFVTNLAYILLLLLVSWLQIGLYPIVILYGLYMLVKSIVTQYYVYQQFNRSFFEYLKLFTGLITSTLIMVAVVLLAQNAVLNDMSVYVDFIVSVILGVLSYVASVYLFEKKTFHDLVGMVANRV